MDNRRRIPVRDVKQIAYEVGLWAIDIEQLRQLNKLLNNSSGADFREKFDNYIEDRIQMVIDRLDNKKLPKT